nr:hypothetical protein [uncultured Acidocella sp.]
MLRWGLPIAVVLIPAYAFFSLGLRSFYINGAWWGDAGMLAPAMWHNGWGLTLPLVWRGDSFLATHMALVFWLTSGLSWLLPVTSEQFFSLFLGGVQGGMALAVYALLRGMPMRRWSAAGLAVLFAFNGMVLAASCNPHFELLIVASGIAFLTCLLHGRHGAALCFFALCLSTREDAGVHLGLLLACGIWALRMQGVAWDRLRPLAGYAVAALGWSASILAIQHAIFPNAAALDDVYLGHGGFPPVSLVTIATRLTFWLIYRLYLVLPIVAAVILAERWRAPSIVAGFISCLPWLALNLLASSPFAGTLCNYYPFPLVFGMAWPLLGHGFALRFQARNVTTPVQAKRAFVTILLCSFVGLWGMQNPQNLRFPREFLSPPSLAMQARTNRAIELVSQAKLGRVVADGAVVALAPGRFQRSQILWGPQPPLPDTVIFFAHGQGTAPALALASQAGLKVFSQIPGTRLRIASKETLSVPGLRLVQWAPPNAAY